MVIVHVTVVDAAKVPVKGKINSCSPELLDPEEVTVSAPQVGAPPEQAISLAAVLLRSNPCVLLESEPVSANPSLEFADVSRAGTLRRTDPFVIPVVVVKTIVCVADCVATTWSLSTSAFPRGDVIVNFVVLKIDPTVYVVFPIHPSYPLFAKQIVSPGNR